jgi:hypothetical protein
MGSKKRRNNAIMPPLFDGVHGHHLVPPTLTDLSPQLHLLRKLRRKPSPPWWWGRPPRTRAIDVVPPLVWRRLSLSRPDWPGPQDSSSGRRTVVVVGGGQHTMVLEEIVVEPSSSRLDPLHHRATAAPRERERRSICEQINTSESSPDRATNLTTIHSPAICVDKRRTVMSGSRPSKRIPCFINILGSPAS